MLTKIPTLQEYYDRLAKHDWYYEFADDAYVWKSGQEDRDALVRFTKLSLEYKKLYQAFEDHYFKGVPFTGNEAPPLPMRPEGGNK